MGVLDGLKVLDLSWGVSGPAAAMLLADNGADVTRIERPEADPFAEWLDGKVYQRGKRSAVLDLTDPDDLARFRKLAATADVLIESFAPGVTARLGIDYDTLAATNPRLVYCTITAYGPTSRFADRPGIDQLVAARLSYQWETRAWPGSALDHVHGVDLLGDSTEFSEEDRHWLKRHGPVVTATPSPSIAAAYLATLGISGALRAREQTGRGQHVETSLLQGIVKYQCCAWQRYEDDQNDGMLGSIMETSPGVGLMSGPWSFYECSDGNWVNNWGGGGASWALLAGAGDTLEGPTREEMQKRGSISAGRGSPADTLRSRLEAVPIFKKFPAAEWVRVAAECGIAMQPVRPPEASHQDSALIAQGSVVEVDDPELGTLRQTGLVYRMHKTPGKVRGGAARRGEHTDEVKAEADAAPETSAAAANGNGASMKGPLDGIKVLDLGVAVAGPWCGELLAQLGAEVIKIDPPRQNFWLATKMAKAVNRSKRHLMLDIKQPGGAEALTKLVAQADVFLTNMRTQAASKLGLDYDSLSKINPKLIYCHTAGFDDSRATLPGNDQVSNTLAGTCWEDGGMVNGGKPYFHSGSGGDLGNGSLGAISIVQALYHRDRTGEGQELDTNIVNAGLFACARVYSKPDGTRFEHPSLDADLLGVSARYGVYECREGWLCLAALTDAHWDALTTVIPKLADDARFADTASRRANDPALRNVLEGEFAGDTADHWFAKLDAAGVPCEVSSIEFGQNFFDDEEMIERELVVTREGQLKHGRVEMFGRLLNYSDTVPDILGPPDEPGQHSREVLREFGFADAAVDQLVADNAVTEYLP
jgi:crotonobetainyl-CoA:carnitine CoA-transferase CaiB-like acyl-CoA transferase